MPAIVKRLNFDKGKRRLLHSWLSIIPVLIILLAIRAYPIVVALKMSFTNWDGLFQQNFIGFSNYIHLFKNINFWIALRNSLVLLINVPIQLILGIIIAVLLYERVCGWKFFRAVFYVPQVISAIIIGYLFKVFFGLSGPFNLILSKIGLGLFSREWFADPATALGVIVVCLVWFNLGWQTILFLGGMASISPSVLEAAEIDGANFWQRTFKVVLPMLTNVLEYSIVLSCVWTFTQLFPFIYSMTKGGPGYDTSTLDYLIYDKAFVYGNRLGEACAIAVILLVVIGIMTVIEIKLLNKSNDWGE
jgi:ABC-type sugar transport system permease subunit